jgi:hypothetical protein
MNLRNADARVMEHGKSRDRHRAEREVQGGGQRLSPFHDPTGGRVAALHRHRRDLDVPLFQSVFGARLDEASVSQVAFRVDGMIRHVPALVGLY